MAGIIGKKIGMTSIYDREGNNVSCTVIEAGPCSVTQVKTKEKDRYEAIQLAFGTKKEKHTTKPMQGHFAKAGLKPFIKLVEFRADKITSKIGEVINLSVFHEGELVNVSGISKGKGFQGVVKRHGFKGVGESTHGQHNRTRAPGSVGACSFPSRVFKGLRMAGRMGNQKTKMRNLEVLKIDGSKNQIYIKGSVPGGRNAYVSIESINSTYGTPGI